jgi:hypothetical protein
MIKKFLLVFSLALGLTGCGLNSSEVDVPTLDATSLNQTAISAATADFVQTQSMLPTPTLTLTSTWTPAPTIDRTRPPLQSPTPEIPCNQAAAGRPIDVTIPDGTLMTPGEDFSKTWRLENVGSCTWTRLYTLTFFSGNSLSAIQNHTLLQEVPPGATIDLTVDMVAPQTPGIYQSNWMLQDSQGELFGIGPNGDAPFWVQIEVRAPVTETPQPTPTLTSTPVVYLDGEAVMVNGDQLDLDTGTLNPGDITLGDFLYRFSSGIEQVLMPLNNFTWMVFGEEQPALEDCVSAEKNAESIVFNTNDQDIYLCYQTSEALPGRLLIREFADGELRLEFITWSVP